MKIALFTDAWRPQINGVVRTLQQTRTHLEARGHETVFVTPLDFATCPCPSYPSIRLALFPGKGVEGILRAAKKREVFVDVLLRNEPMEHARTRYRAFSVPSMNVLAWLIKASLMLS